jgi:pSer/pThr/pTyr-binding forkhead associated (FHA) protein
MEPTANVPDPAGPAGAVGELVVQNGRLSGTRRPLAPLTLIGQAPGCDLRLNVEGVAPLHCVIVQAPAGPVLRDLTEAGTTVNGERVRERALRHGDRVAIGPFLFAVELPDPPADAEAEALRIQAAAVVAQQAALDEEEDRLEGRATALQKQEAQLAAHLEDRQRQLEEAEGTLQQERDALRAECRAAREALDGERAAVLRERTSAGQERLLASRERARLAGLRRRLRQRWRRQFQAHEAELKLREAELAGAREALERERERVTQFHLRVNGELELGRRQLREEWQELGLAQQGWEVTLNREQADRHRQAQEVDARARALADAERTLVETQRQWQLGQAQRLKEAEGLDARVKNARARLAEVEQKLGRPASAAEQPPFEPLPPAPARPEERSDATGRLARLAGDLGDQRHHLMEQWEQLLALHERWQQERARVLAEWEGQVRALARREQEVAGSEGRLHAGLADLARRQEEAARVRLALEGARARLAAEEALARAERDRSQSDVEQREQALALRGRQLEEVQRRRQLRRQEERAELHAARQRWAELYQRYHELQEEAQGRQTALLRQERELAGRSLALDRYHEELLARSPSAARAESRIQQLRKREAARLEEIGRALEAQLEGVRVESALVAEQAATLEAREAGLLERQGALERSEQAWEERQQAAAGEEEQARRTLHQLRMQHALDARLLLALREEVERMARLLIEEGEPAEVAQQAA